MVMTDDHSYHVCDWSQNSGNDNPALDTDALSPLTQSSHSQLMRYRGQADPVFGDVFATLTSTITRQQ